MAWATLEQVEAVTGVEVTAPQLAAAQSVIEIYANRESSTDHDATLTARDARALKQAVAWQAVWQAQQAGYDTRSAFRQLDQDGLRVTTDSQSDVMLAPLAARALRNLSWKAQRTTVVRPTTVGLSAHPDLIDYLDESNDGRHPWELL